jgi:iron-sulfur cluster insertion protein
MSEVISERRITISDSAARRIAALKAQEAAEGAFLRIAVSGGGCSGFQYGLSFDEETSPDVSLELLNGSEVDFVEDLMGASFQIKNPNAASSCGCGNSFSI